MTKLERIMHVEDDLSIQQVAKIALEAVGGFTVFTCSSGQQALAEYPLITPQLLLLDVMMPGMDGPTTLQKLQQQYDLSKVPAIFMTAKVQDAEIASYKMLGAVAVLVKPFDPMTLSDQIRQIWADFHH
ncbi:response regulator [Rheinheimera sp. D18]|uniref:response regulator n=1 Tax=Rheinheimera sp. D18 TaxID=2545632 RepID=UPI0010534278|nr:response regulator [Rheinheimera sp. D18]QBL08144.1 response regulator [Rheinheimera sp. D18]